MSETRKLKAPTDLREFIGELEEAGELVRLKKTVSTKHVIGSLARKSELQNGLY